MRDNENDVYSRRVVLQLTSSSYYFFKVKFSSIVYAPREITGMTVLVTRICVDNGEIACVSHVCVRRYEDDKPGIWQEGQV